jgi:glycosyltransferase involved in cell wall biosynthesis
VKILLWHGYLLRGSGSNIYCANTAAAWRAQGHDVLVLCQERDVAGLDFVDSAGVFAPDNRSFTTTDTGVPAAAGRVRVVNPDIGEILPVYVFDEYEGFSAKLFVDLADDELRDYTDRNVSALATAISEFEPEALITGHEVMGPFIAKLACEPTGTPFIAKLHGSALEYAVKLEKRYRDYASEGLSAAARVIGGSNYMVEEASRVIPGWRDKAEVINPGCDVELFRPAERTDDPPTVAFVGKLIASKGVHNFLASLGLTTIPGLRAVVVGYGGFEVPLHALWHSLHTGARDEALAIARRGEEGPLDALEEFLASAEDDYFARAAEIPLEFTGRLDHGPLSLVLPTFDVLVVPSVLPEAFGMVAAEAAAAGVIPIVPDHSGIGEIGAAVEEALGRPGFVTFDPADPINGISAAIERVLALSPPELAEARAAVVALARSRWAWTRVADLLLAAATRR